MDFWISSPDEAVINIVAQKFPPLWAPAAEDSPAHIIRQARFENGAEWVYVPVGSWDKPTGETTTDAMGNTRPVMGNDGRFYALARWNGDVTDLHFEQAGGTVNVDPATGVMIVEIDGVTLTAPPPVDVPISF